jgi:hypothetical protein
MAPTSMIPKLRRAAAIMRQTYQTTSSSSNQNNNNNNFDAELSAYEKLSRLSSQRLIGWLNKQIPLVPTGNGNKLKRLMKNEVHVECCLRLALRDECQELTYLDSVKHGEIYHALGEVMNVEEDQRNYSSIYGNNAKGTGHGRSKLNSVNCTIISLDV